MAGGLRSSLRFHENRGHRGRGRGVAPRTPPDHINHITATHSDMGYDIGDARFTAIRLRNRQGIVQILAQEWLAHVAYGRPVASATGGPEGGREHERSRPLGMPVAWIEPTSQAPPIYRKEDTNRRFASLSQRALVKRRVHTQGSGSCTTGGRWNRRLSSSRQAVHRTTSDGRRPGTPRAAQCLRECIRSSCSAT